MTDNLAVGRRIVCAANRIKESGVVILGVRHYDHHMHEGYDAHFGKGERYGADSEEQGFVCNRGEFWNRQAAYVIAEAAGQIIRKTGNVHGRELFSEDLY